MAEELENARIDQLPKNAILKGSYPFPIYNFDTQKTERVDLAEILSSSTTQNFQWVTDNDPGYALDEVVTYGGKWWQSLVNNNLNVIPGTDATKWLEVSKSPSGFVFWQPGIYPQDEVFVLYPSTGDIQIYHLKSLTRPYVSSNLEAELAAGDWEIISGGADHYKGLYTTSAALTAAYPTASPGDYAFVDAGAGQDVQFWIWDNSDNVWKQGGSSPVPIASPTVAGISKLYAVTGANADGSMNQQAITNAIAAGAVPLATDTVAGKAKLYDTAGTAIDGSMTQRAINDLAGGGVGFYGSSYWNYNGAAIVPPPASGRLRFNSLTIGLITEMYIHEISATGQDVSNFFLQLQRGDAFYIQQKNDATKWLRAFVNGTPVDNGTSWTIPLSIVSTGGTIFTNNQDLAVRLTIDAGDPSVIQNALNLKADELFTVSAKTGSYTIAAADLTAINVGKSYIIEGNNTGDITMPPNATVAMPVGSNFGVRGFANVIQGAGVTVTGSNGSLVILTGRTVILEKVGTDSWKLHNGVAAPTVWDATTSGTVERSTQVESEAVAVGASTSSTAGLGDNRASGELGMYYMLRKWLTLALTWSIGPIITDATADTAAYFDSTKKLISRTVVQFLDWLGANPISTAVSLVSTTVTLDCASKYSKKWHTVAAHSANFTLTKSNKTLVEYGNYLFQVTGTVVIQLDTDDRMPDDTPGWNLAAKTVTLISGGTGLLYSLGFVKHIAGYYIVTISTKTTV